MQCCSREWQRKGEKKLIAAKIGEEKINENWQEGEDRNGKVAASDINVVAGRADDGTSF